MKKNIHKHIIFKSFFIYNCNFFYKLVSTVADSYRFFVAKKYKSANKIALLYHIF